MNRALTIILTVALTGLAALGIEPNATRDVFAQQFPASAVIRGENIYLRAQPAVNTQVITLLQRGDRITITGAPTAADGDEFYPVEDVQTGQTGWVRVIFVNPESIVPLAQPAPQPGVTPVPTTPPEKPAKGNQNKGNQGKNQIKNQNKGNQNASNQKKRNQRNATAEATTPTPEAAAPAATPTPPTPVPEQTGIAFTGVGAATSEPVTLQPGRYRATATMEVSAPTGFLCNLNGPRNFSETLFDEQIDSPQSWTARTSITIDTAGDYVVECSKTNDPWTISFEPRGGG